MTIVVTVIIFIIVLAVLILVHEFGHFIVAKACGIRVDAFALGFGPRIVSWKGKETEYAINWIPFGGYVKIYGEDPTAEAYTGPHSARSFVRKSKWQQIAVLIAGVAGNFIFAWILFAAMFIKGGNVPLSAFPDYSAYSSNQRIIVVANEADSPAAQVGIGIGDVIQSITSKGITTNVTTTNDIQSIVDASGGSPMTFTYVKGGQTKTALVSAVTTCLPSGKYAIGIVMDKIAYVKMPVFTAIKESFVYTANMVWSTITGLYTFFTGLFVNTASSLNQVAGPVGIAVIVGDANQLGFAYLVIVVALISISLGVINLIPFPALDGGRILFVIIESIIRRPIPAKFSNTVNMVGFALLMVLMILVTYKDIIALIWSNPPSCNIEAAVSQ